MNQVNQDTNSASLGNLPVKRKRGRPRKDESLIRRENASSVTPRSDMGKKTRHRKTEPTVADNTMVGQAVSGVLEASFDAGYVVTVRVGNTNTILRGVVFVPGLSVPITGANDVAPHVKMFKRNESPLNIPSKVHGSTHQFEQKNEQPVKLLQGIEVTVEPKVSRRVKQVPKDSKLKHEIEPSFENLQGNKAIDQVPRVQHQVMRSELEPDQPIDDTVKGQAVELNHAHVAASSQDVTTQLVVELSKMLQENQTLRKCDTPQAVLSLNESH